MLPLNALNSDASYVRAAFILLKNFIQHKKSPYLYVVYCCYHYSLKPQNRQYTSQKTLGLTVWRVKEKIKFVKTHFDFILKRIKLSKMPKRPVNNLTRYILLKQ